MKYTDHINAIFRGQPLLCPFCGVKLSFYYCAMVPHEWVNKLYSVPEDIKLKCRVCQVEIDVPDEFSNEIQFVEEVPE